MSIPIRQQFKVATYILKQRLRGVQRYPLTLMLEPLFRCNLACAGCGKIAYPDHILKQRLAVADCLAAAEECGAPVVSIAGGEPLLHPEIEQIVVRDVLADSDERARARGGARRSARARCACDCSPRLCQWRLACPAK